MLKDENLLVELPIYGDFEKFNSNTGWSSGVGLLPDAAIGPGWRARGSICDLQGHRGAPGGVKLGCENRYYTMPFRTLQC